MAAILDGTTNYGLTDCDFQGKGGPGGQTAPPIAISAWIKPTLVNGTSQTFAHIGWGTTTTDNGVSLYMGTDNKFAIQKNGTGSFNLSSGVTATANTWYHICLNIDSSFNYTLYVNGTLSGTHNA